MLKYIKHFDTEANVFRKTKKFDRILENTSGTQDLTMQRGKPSSAKI